MAKLDVYRAVTERIMEALEQGTVPWRKPWVDTGAPYSIRSGRPYRGINPFLLSMEPYSDPRWGTYKAIKEAGGNVRKGERATHIVLWKPVRKEIDENTEERYMLLRQYAVFNAEQADGLPDPPEVEKRDHTPVEAAEAVLYGYSPGPWIEFGGNEAWYSVTKDTVRCPSPEFFHTVGGYYGALFHELVHSTGHEKRLNRIEPALFGTDPYAREELVAEMGSAMLLGHAGLEADYDNSAAYIGGWLKALANDRKLVVQAAAQAQRAVDLMLGTTFDDEDSRILETAGAA